MSQTPKKWPSVPFLLNKGHVDFWEGIQASSWKMYDSIDHMVACGFYGMCFTTFKSSTRITRINACKHAPSN